MTEPEIKLEGKTWTLISKPHGMPSAPLHEDEQGTLLNWFLAIRPESRAVTGKKPIEHGLLHRLDTGTAGLVLVAKTQESYDSLLLAQKNGLIRKTYYAFCDQVTGKGSSLENLPIVVRSRFRGFGPGSREVRPLFPGMRGYEDSATDYETSIIKVALFTESELLPEDCTASRSGKTVIGLTCSLVRGYRHQVRAHLALLGYPIIGDPLYNPESNPILANGESLPLQLYAPGISFPDPDSGQPVSFSLPPPDRMSL